MSDFGAYDLITDKVIGAAIEVHRHLGPGLLASTYRACLAHEMRLRGLQLERRKPLPVWYKGLTINCGYRVDFWVDGRVIVQVKTLTQLLPIHEAEMIAFLQLSQCRVGLLLNFHTPLMKDGIHRYVV